MNEFFNALKNRRARKEYIKSSAVGILATAVDFLLQALIVFAAGHESFDGFFSVFSGKTITGEPFELPVSIYMTSLFVSFILSVALNYLLSVFFVFEYGNVGKNKRSFLKFCIFSLFGLAITITVSLIGFVGMGGNIWVIKIITALVVFVFNFFTRKYFVFNIALIRDDDNTINL